MPCRSQQSAAYASLASPASWPGARVGPSRAHPTVPGPEGRLLDEPVPPEIEADLAAVAALVEEHGMRSIARCIHEERAGLAVLRGDEEGFRAELGRARDVAAEIGASGHLERLEHALAAA